MKRKTRAYMQVGDLRIQRINVSEREWRDFYHWVLSLRWSRFSFLVLGVYLAVNLAFAGLYVAGPASIAEMKPGSFSDAFFFSVETLATVGYGHMYPQTVYGHIVSTAEIITGMFGMAVTTGIIFVRFSRPSARFEFSRCVVVGQFDGGPSLMLRIANLRPQAMVNAEFRIVLIRKEVTREGVPFHQYHPLSLAMDRAILFPAVVTLRHVIDERSPLRGVTAEQLAESHSRLLVLVTCVDTVIPSPVESQKAYTWHDVLYGHRFVQIYRDIEDELLEVDYARIHETEPDSLPQPPP